MSAEVSEEHDWKADVPMLVTPVDDRSIVVRPLPSKAWLPRAVSVVGTSAEVSEEHE